MDNIAKSVANEKRFVGKKDAIMVITCKRLPDSRGSSSMDIKNIEQETCRYFFAFPIIGLKLDPEYAPGECKKNRQIPFLPKSWQRS